MKNIVNALEPLSPATNIPAPAGEHLNTNCLGKALPGFRGFISGIDTSAVLSSCSGFELERRLLEMGFVEGHAVEVLHQGSFKGDPIAVRVGSSTVAIRRCEAMAIIVI